jgi:hypothetical protein
MPFLRMATMIFQTILVDGYGSKLKAWWTSDSVADFVAGLKWHKLSFLPWRILFLFHVYRAVQFGFLSSQRSRKRSNNWGTQIRPIPRFFQRVIWLAEGTGRASEPTFMSQVGGFFSKKDVELSGTHL